MLQGATGQRWAIVLAAGEGSRLRELTSDEFGVCTPKQFCSLHGERSLLEEALARAECSAPVERTLVVVAAAHEPWWRAQLAALPPQNILVQPANRGTAAGVLLPLASILARDPDATVALFPSDHFVAREAVLACCMRRGFEHAELAGETVLLGITPDAPEREYGWIVPGTALAGAPRPVCAFVEKPDQRDADELFQSGALWSSFLIVARADALASGIRAHLPQLARTLAGCERLEPHALAALYERVPHADFSRDVLQREAQKLRVLAVPPCGWTDLGTPRRVAACLESATPREYALRPELLSLSRSLARCGAPCALAH